MNLAHKPSHTQWLKVWRELATLTQGITQGDPRLGPVMKALDACDTAYLAYDWSGFQMASLTVRQRMEDKVTRFLGAAFLTAAITPHRK